MPFAICEFASLTPLHPLALSQSIANLRKSRLRPERDMTMSRDLAAVADETRRAAKSLAGVGPAWAQACPPELLERTRVESLHRAVLTIAVDDTSAKYLLDRWLREGGEAALIRLSPAAVRKVKLVVGTGGAPATPPSKSKRAPSPKRRLAG